MPLCSHTPDGTIMAHIEVWKTPDGEWAVLAFARPELDPTCVAQCGDLGPALGVAAETLTDAVNELDEELAA
jgi:hypothetical protein